MFNKAKGCKTRQIAFGTCLPLDLLACIKQALPMTSGFAQKANVEPEAELIALALVRLTVIKEQNFLVPKEWKSAILDGLGQLKFQDGAWAEIKKIFEM